MIKGIAQIGIAVGNLEKAKGFYEKVLSLKSTEAEFLGELKYPFMALRGTHIEFLEPTTPEGGINKFIEKKGEGVRHIPYEVDDIGKEVKALKADGVQFVTQKPYLNAHGNLIIFIHPKWTGGVLTELIQFVGGKHS
jgi:methylmalonyl-CoA/ethylmalonyl-CoA epimerase